MKTSCWLVFSCGLLCFSNRLFAQGALTPPGAPAPTMKTLSQIEPRTLLNDANTPGDAAAIFVINQPGSYYLTANIIGAAGKNGIRIDASNVTLDLMGFELIGVTSSQNGIFASPSTANIAIFNGSATGWPQQGIDMHNAGSVILKDLQAAGNGGAGIIAGSSAMIAGCIVSSNLANGITTGGDGLVKSCVASGNGAGSAGIGILAANRTLISECTADLNRNDGIRVTSDCYLINNHASGNGMGATAAGIHTTGTNNRIDQNQVSSNSGYGILSDGGTGADVVVRNNSRNNILGGFSPASGATFGPLSTPATATSPWANFLAAFNLGVSKAGLGSGTVSSSPAGINCGANCGNNFDAGTIVTLTATANSNSVFAGWSGDATGTGVAVITVDAVKAVTATFDLIPFMLTVNNAGGGTVTSSSGGINCPGNCSANYAPSTTVTLTATPSAGATFVGWSGADSTSGNTATVTMTSARSVTATFSYPVSVANSGGGTVTSVPGGISCPGTCSTNYNYGTTLTLTATPSVGATFMGWIGADSVSGNTATVIMNNARSVTATFAYSLSLSKSGTGGGTVTSSPAGINCGATCTANYNYGTSVTLTATPDASSTFAGWSGAASGTGSATVTMDANRAVTATFTPIQYALTVTNAGGGTVSSSPAGISCSGTCSANYNSGTTVTLTATPNAGATSFVSWIGADSVSGNTATVTMLSARSVTATFSYPLSVANSGGGTVTSSPSGISCPGTCSTNYNYGTTITFTATPSAGATFVGWSGADSVSGNTATVAMTSARLVTATFAYPLSVANSGGGTVTSSPGGISCPGTCSTNYNYGTTLTLTATPSTGATFSSWIGADSTSGNTATVTMNSVKSLTATFSWPLSVSKSGTGTGTVTSLPAGINCGATCAANYAAGTIVNLTATANSGSSFAGWSGAATGTGTANISMNGIKSVTATFTSP